MWISLKILSGFSSVLLFTHCTLIFNSHTTVNHYYHHHPWNIDFFVCDSALYCNNYRLFAVAVQFFRCVQLNYNELFFFSCCHPFLLPAWLGKIREHWLVDDWMTDWTIEWMNGWSHTTAMNWHEEENFYGLAISRSFVLLIRWVGSSI